MDNIFKFYSTVSERLDLLPPSDGQLIFVTDTRTIYLDDGENRVQYSDIILLNDEAHRQGIIPFPSFYFVKSTGVLWRYDTDTDWVQLTSTPKEQVAFLSELPNQGVENVLYIIDIQMFKWDIDHFVELGASIWESL